MIPVRFYIITMFLKCKENPSRLEKEVVVITGGTDGIGKALVKQFIANGSAVATCGRSPEKLKSLQQELGNTDILIQACDVSKEEDCRHFIQNVTDKLGRIDILINNAGVSMHAMLADCEPEVIKKVMEINFMGMVYCTRFALEWIVRSKGTIAGISSIAGYRGLPGRSGYSASKFAMNGWLEAIRTELSADGVNVLWVAPGFTRSNVRIAALTKDGTQQGTSPLDESRLMTAGECAAHIIKAIRRKKRNLILTWQGKQTVYMNKFCPSLTDRLIRKFFFKNGKLIK